MKQLQERLYNVYKKIFSRSLKFLFGGGCRYYPTCSDYSQEALEKFGWAKGTRLSLKRLSHCHPFSKSDYYDPLPIK